jgi:DNA recombination protein RmuC
MQALIAAIAAAFAGIVLGFLLRSVAAKAEKAQTERRSEELAAELSAVRAALSQAQAESQSQSAARAGFESLASERAATMAQLAAERDRLRTELQARGEAESRSAARISQLEAELRNERQNLADKLALLETAKQALAHQFEALAGEILEKKSKSFAEGSQKELGTLLTPLRDQIKEFREKVEKVQTESSNGVTKLETLIGTLGGLNQQLSAEARNLTTALRGSSKAQGDWGELIVRNLLEKAGLREGEQFRVQETFDAADNGDERQKKARPDVIVNLPTEELRKAAVKRHLASVRGHVDELAAKRYHKLSALETPDFVVMFIPIEPAFLEALHEDEGLWRYAYEKEVLLVGPTTLLFVIRIVDNLWQQELQARSVQDVMSRGAELYDKFVNFVSDLEAVGKSLRGADQSYSSAMKKLGEGRGNLIRQVEMLKQLGIRTSKSLPRGLLDNAGVEGEGLALAAEAEETADAE